jgi:acyl-CoA synthetase (AMP-forming)/AMP-acid ligase II
MHHIEFRSPEERVIARLLEEQAKANPDAIWLMMDDTSCTFGEAQAIVERLAGGFQEIGIRRGETVALMLENSMEHVWTVLALATIGAVGIPINTAYKGYFLRSILETSQPVAVVVESELAEIMLTAMGCRSRHAQNRLRPSVRATASLPQSHSAIEIRFRLCTRGERREGRRASSRPTSRGLLVQRCPLVGAIYVRTIGFTQ